MKPILKKDVRIKSRKLRVYFAAGTVNQYHITRAGALKAQVTHDYCECGSIKTLYNSKCGTCRSIDSKNALLELPIKPWDGKGFIYLDDINLYFDGIAAVKEYLFENDIINLDDLIFFHTSPNYLKEIDTDYWEDEYPDDSSFDDVASDELQEMLDALNQKIKEHGPISWSANDYRVGFSCDQINYLLGNLDETEA